MIRPKIRSFSVVKSSSEPIWTPASASNATPSLYSRRKAGSTNSNGSHGNCLLIIAISVANLYKFYEYIFVEIEFNLLFSKTFEYLCK